MNDRKFCKITRSNTGAVNVFFNLVLTMAFVSTILCVDDDEDDLHFIHEIIVEQQHRFTIDTCNNGWEALRYLEQAAENELLPCLVIMDVNMPRMDGKETIRRIKAHEQLSTIPVVVFTTSSNKEDRSYFEGLGVHFFTKPFDYKVFTRQIVDLLAFCADQSTQFPD